MKTSFRHEVVINQSMINRDFTRKNFSFELLRFCRRLDTSKQNFLLVLNQVSLLQNLVLLLALQRTRIRLLSGAQTCGVENPYFICCSAAGGLRPHRRVHVNIYILRVEYFRLAKCLAQFVIV
jgi:hypothetical protein